jgi:hypothetical protein
LWARDLRVCRSSESWVCSEVSPRTDWQRRPYSTTLGVRIAERYPAIRDGVFFTIQRPSPSTTSGSCFCLATWMISSTHD